MRRTLTRSTLPLALIALLACSGDGGGRADAAAPTDPRDVTYAAELGVDLDAMERSPTGLFTQTLQEGAGEAARAGDTLLLHYTGWLPDGSSFDTSRDGDPFRIVLGVTSLIEGWTEGVEGMRVGETRRLVIPPALAYGAGGAGKVIPPNATLVFDVELVERIPAGPPGGPEGT